MKINLYKRYLPDIILFPIYGEHSIMWQPTTGKYRQSKGRFIFPYFFEKNLEREIFKTLGNFRWEMCRTEQGIYWDDFHYPSLTSGYTDYLQFYKKNIDLSTEMKAKIKTQLQSCNNRFREVFTKDYYEWINRESHGNPYLNKVSRAIMSSYCPFSKEIRKGLLDKNQYQESFKKFTIQKNKIEREYQMVQKRFEKEKQKMPTELVETMEYLKKTL